MRGVVSLVGAYFLVSALGGWILTHPPRPAPSEPPAPRWGPGIGVEDVVVPPVEPAGPALHAWFVPARRAGAGAVVFLHGYRGRRTQHGDVAARLARRTPHALLLPDLRGSGANPRWATTAGVAEADDALACVRFLARRGFEPERIALFGSSMGAVAATLCAADPRLGGELAGLLLVSPYDDLEAAIDRRFRRWVGLGARPWFSPTLWFAERFASCELTSVDVPGAAARARARERLVLGLTDDWRAPIEGVERIARRLGARLERVPGRGHHVFATPAGERLRALCVDTLARWLGDA